MPEASDGFSILSIVTGRWHFYPQLCLKPLFLLGDDSCASGDRTLIDLLSENVDSVNIISQDEHEITLSCDYHYGSTDKPKTRNVTVTLDPQHGFLPKYAEFKRIPFNVLTTRMKITKFTETSNGIWFPVEALDEEFYMDEPIQEDGVHYQNGMTADELLAMTEEDRWKVIPSLGYRSVHLSTLTYRVNPKTLKINEPFDESLLTLDRFPDGMDIWDDILQLGYKVGRFDDPNYVETAKTETWWTVVRILFIAIGTAIVFLGIGLHLKKRLAVKTE